MILISNDDGISANGLFYLSHIASLYDDVVVLAPDKPRSACSSSITINEPLICSSISKDGNISFYSLSGTPTDCVKYAVEVLLNEKPKLILSGINHGTNTSINSLYSGTVSVAIEGCLKNIPSIAFSHISSSISVDYSSYVPFIKKIINFVLSWSLPSGVCLNVNLPLDVPKGIRVVRQAKACWINEIERRNNDEFWIGGKFVCCDDNDENDISFLDSGYVTVVPLKIDMTDFDFLSFLKNKLQ